MPAAGFIVVSTQPSRAEAELLAGLLRSGGMRVLVEGADDVEYPTSVAGGYRVTVPADRAAEAEQLLAGAGHVDAADPASSLDVGLPIDEDVRDYLAWKRQTDAQPAHVAAPEQAPAVMTGQQAARLPLLPLLGLAAVVVALVLWLR